MNEQQRKVLERMGNQFDVPGALSQIHEELGRSPEDVANVMLKLEGAFRKEFGGQPQFTGKARTYKNGAIAFEVRCRKCQGCFWVTNLPFALCVDCDPVNLFRD